MKEKLRLMETFSGIGAQVRGIEDTNLFDVELVGTSEIDKDAILSYAAIHCGLTPELVESYSDYPTEWEMAEELTRLNIGYDFVAGRAYNWSRLVNSKTDELKKYWLANKLSKNLGDISLIQELPMIDLLTFSFPCTDISSIGKRRGMQQGETRSGLIWEIIRLLRTAKEKNALPKYMLLENVKNLVGFEFINQFNELNNIIEDIGYVCFWSILNAAECGVPQARERVFGIYIRKDTLKFNYTFPLPLDLGINCKHILETNVDKRYYHNSEVGKSSVRAWIARGDINLRHNMSAKYKIKNITSFLDALANDDLEALKGYITKNESNKIQIACEIRCNRTLRSVSERYMTTLRTIDACGDKRVVELDEDGAVEIRDLTPRESWRLMGFLDADIDKCISVGVQRAALYKQAGNSIVTTCIKLLMEHLYKTQYDITYKTTDSRLEGSKLLEDACSVTSLYQKEKLIDGVYIAKSDNCELTAEELMQI